MQEQSIASNWLAADFLSHSYRISGRVNVRHRKLADQLNDHTTSFLLIENTYISNIEHPAEIATSHANAILNKNNITAVVVSHHEDGLPREHTYGSYFGAYVSHVFLTVPSFEIEGNLRLSSKLDLRTVLTTGTDAFITILDGQLRSSIRTDVTFTGGAVLINKGLIGAFCMAEE